MTKITSQFTLDPWANYNNAELVLTQSGSQANIQLLNKGEEVIDIALNLDEVYRLASELIIIAHEMEEENDD